MKKLMSLLMVSAFVVGLVGVSFAAPKFIPAEKKSGSAFNFKEFAVYVDDKSQENHFLPSGWMGDTGDLDYIQSCSQMPKRGKNCIKINYTAKKIQGAGWAGIFWQQPASNWGDKKGGYDLTGATKLTFWARGAKGGEKIAEFKMGGITGEYPDSDTSAIGPVVLTKEWKLYTIDLTGKDLSYVIGGFSFAISAKDNPNGCVFYLDNISYK